MNRDILEYVPTGTQQFGYGIDPARVLTTKERGVAKTRFMEWARPRLPGPLPPPNLIEVRWSDDLKHVYVPKDNGAAAFAFHSLFPEHGPIHETKAGAIYSDANPAAHALLAAIAYAVKPWQEQ